MTLSGKAWQRMEFERAQADDRYGLRDGGTAEDIYLEGRQHDHEPAPGIGRVHRVAEDDLDEAA